jgi:hypothetical protein
MDVCVYSVFMLSYIGSGLATGLSPAQGILPTVYSIKETEVKRWKCFTDPLCTRGSNNNAADNKNNNDNNNNNNNNNK